METITNLIKDTPIPKMVKVRQNFDKTCIPESDIAGTIVRELDRPEIGGKIQPGQKIAITCGSRGINHNALMARAIVDFVKSKGAEPFIVAAMGSHGGATAEGQLQILKDYGHAGQRSLLRGSHGGRRRAGSGLFQWPRHAHRQSHCPRYQDHRQ